MGGLSKIVGAVSIVPACLCVALRHRAPVPVTAVLGHIAATGFLVAWAASDQASKVSLHGWLNLALM